MSSQFELPFCVKASEPEAEKLEAEESEPGPGAEVAPHEKETSGAPSRKKPRLFENMNDMVDATTTARAKPACAAMISALFDDAASF